MQLFRPIVPGKSLHPNFITTLRPGSASVRRIISQWADGFVDRDGKFVKEFQTTYNSAFWELYLYAVFKSLGVNIDFSHDAPDFVAADHPFAVEATIASHAQGDTPEWEKRFEAVMAKDVFASQAQSAIRASNALLGKSEAYKKRYSKLPHMMGRSYVVAISNYGTPDFNLLGDVPMQHLLYDNLDLGHFKKANGAKVPLGLFKNRALAHVSAVMYSSVATFGKARALSDDEGQFVFQAVRILNNLEPIRILATKDTYEESLTDGLRIFTNPYASIPLELDCFDDSGIRKIAAERNGDFVVSCHPKGDLCLRMVHALVAPGTAKRASSLQQKAYILNSKTIRIAAGLTQMAAAVAASELCDFGYTFDKKRVKHIEARQSLPWGEAEAYLDMLRTLEQEACTPRIRTSLRKRPRI